jgi:phosphodiesterase/alkaline phosphatase D-like protein
MALLPFLNRRTLIRSGLGAGVMASAWPLHAAWPRNVDANPRLPDYPFTLGVASGDPAPDGFVIWTRLAPAPPNSITAWPARRSSSAGKSPKTTVSPPS